MTTKASSSPSAPKTEYIVANPPANCKTHTIPAAYKGIVDHMARFFAEHPELLKKSAEAQS